MPESSVVNIQTCHTNEPNIINAPNPNIIPMERVLSCISRFAARLLGLSISCFPTIFYVSLYFYGIAGLLSIKFLCYFTAPEYSRRKGLCKISCPVSQCSEHSFCAAAGTPKAGGAERREGFRPYLPRLKISKGGTSLWSAALACPCPFAMPRPRNFLYLGVPFLFCENSVDFTQKFERREPRGSLQMGLKVLK